MAKRKQEIEKEKDIDIGDNGYTQEETVAFGLADKETVIQEEQEPDVLEAELEQETERDEEASVEGNGHQARLTKEQIEIFEEKELDKDIPGKGYLFHVKEKHLPEATRLNEREVMGFSIGNVQQAVLDHDRTQSAFDIFKNSVFQLKIALGGEGRKENIILHQLTAEERDAARGGMFGNAD